MQEKRDHAARRRHLAPSQLVLRVVVEARIVDLGHGRMVGQELGYFQSVVAVGRHAQGQRLQAAQGQKAIHGARHGADGILQELQLLVGRVVIHDQGAADHVGVAAQILGGAVHDEVGAQGQRPLQGR